MKFTGRQIELAIELKSMGLVWEPAVGNYVYDATGEVKPTSPFQEHVYFLLNYDCFMQRVGIIERFKTIMTWLPTWSDAREILRSLGVSEKEGQDELLRSQATSFRRQKAFKSVSSRLCLTAWSRSTVHISAPNSIIAWCRAATTACSSDVMLPTMFPHFFAKGVLQLSRQHFKSCVSHPT